MKLQNNEPLNVKINCSETEKENRQQKWAVLGPDLRTQMSMAPPGEAWGDNHPLRNRPLMLIWSILMTHTNTNRIVMLGAVGAGARSVCHCLGCHACWRFSPRKEQYQVLLLRLHHGFFSLLLLSARRGVTCALICLSLLLLQPLCFFFLIDQGFKY